MQFGKSHWLGNKWPCIEIDPVDMAYFLPVLTYLSTTYGFPMPNIGWAPDGYFADFEILESMASMNVDAFTFSIAFDHESVRDQILAALRALPPDFLQPREP